MCAYEKQKEGLNVREVEDYIISNLDEINETRSESDNDFLLGQTYAYLDCLEYLKGKSDNSAAPMGELERKYNLK